MKAQESSKDWFGKGGMSVLGAHVNIRIDHNISSHFLDLIVNGDGDQDVATSIALVDALVHHIRKTYPQIKSMFIISDNGSHFSSFDMLYFIHRLNERLKDMEFRVARWIFTEPQWGKSRLDTHFAYLKALIKRWLSWLHDVQTPRDVFIALTKDRRDGSGMIKNSSVALIAPILPKLPMDEKRSARGVLKKTMGIRSVAEATYLESGDIVLRQLSNLSGSPVGLTGALSIWSKTEMHRFYVDTETRITVADHCLFQRGPHDAPKTRQRRAEKIALKTGKQSMMAIAVAEFQTNAAQSQQEEDARRRQSHLPNLMLS